jgi:hypothetical protein
MRGQVICPRKPNRVWLGSIEDIKHIPSARNMSIIRHNYVKIVGRCEYNPEVFENPKFDCLGVKQTIYRFRILAGICPNPSFK